MALPATFEVLVPQLFQGVKQSITIGSGLTFLVGPNGSGKTHVLRALHAQMQKKFSVVRYLSADRLAPLGAYRSSFDGSIPGLHHADNLIAGNRDYVPHRHKSETILGDFLALKQRPDLLLKVRARLRSLFQRDIHLDWAQGGLRPQLGRTDVKSEPYSAAREASGLLHLVSLLAALHDDVVKALLVDEPEVSIHPQWQSFLLQEMRAVAGDPGQAGKKLVVLSTHSPSMMDIRRPADLASIVFFSDASTPPRQILSDAKELQWQGVKTLLARMAVAHKLAFFCPRVLLVEVVSDEIICGALGAKLDLNFGASGVQIVPVVGKGEIAGVRDAFLLMGKQVALLTDLDSLSDDGNLLKSLAGDGLLNRIAAKHGHRDFRDIMQPVKSDLAAFVDSHWSDIASLAESHAYWTGRDKTKGDEGARRRAGLAVLLSTAESEVKKWPNGDSWTILRSRALALMAMMEEAGCFILQKGTIEDYYSPATSRSSNKPYAATEEAGSIFAEDEALVKARYDVPLRAIRYVARVPAVDETALFREVLAAVVAAALINCTVSTTDMDLNSRIRSLVPEYASLFVLKNCSRDGATPEIEVSMASTILDATHFPLRVRRGDDLFALLNR